MIFFHAWLSDVFFQYDLLGNIYLIIYYTENYEEKSESTLNLAISSPSPDYMSA